MINRDIINKNNTNWRSDPITEKQKVYILEMQEFSELPLPIFCGKTKGEASDYINRYIKVAYESILEHHEDWGDIRD